MTEGAEPGRNRATAQRSQTGYAPDRVDFTADQRVRLWRAQDGLRKARIHKHIDQRSQDRSPLVLVAKAPSVGAAGGRLAHEVRRLAFLGGVLGILGCNVWLLAWILLG
jgi:hypothetical protein